MEGVWSISSLFLYLFLELALFYRGDYTEFLELAEVILPVAHIYKHEQVTLLGLQRPEIYRLAMEEVM